MTMAMLGLVAYCYVGSSGGAPKPEALRLLSCDTESGAVEVLQTVQGIEGTSYLQLDGEGRYLYSIVGPGRAPKGQAVRFGLKDRQIGPMEVLAELPCPTPCHVRLSPDEKLFAFATYGAGTAGTLPSAGGAVASYVFPDDAMGPNEKRQQKAYAHCAFFTPDGRRLGVIDLGCDRIRFFDPLTMAVDASLEIKTDAGDGPRHAVWSKDGRFLFVVNELSSTVLTYAFPSSASSGSRPVRIGKWTMLPPEFDRRAPNGESPSSKASAIKLTADGKVLMASNRGYDSIAFYAVDAATGALTLRNVAKLCGRYPRDFELMPGEKFMVVGHELSNEIQSYRFDRESFALTPVGKPIAARRPVCVSFGPVR